MMYPFMTLNDDTEITHSEMKPDGRVKVYIETPDEKYCFKHATCWLPDYSWEDVFQYSDDDINRFTEIIRSMAHLIMEFSQEGGFDNAFEYVRAQMGIRTLEDLDTLLSFPKNDIEYNKFGKDIS